MTSALPLQFNFDNDDSDRRGQKSESAYRTISEVATEIDVPQHVLRFWESKFKQISPLKRGGGRRYYRPQDIDLIKRIHYLLYTQGYTIKGVQKLLTKDRQLKQSVPTLGEDDSAVVSVAAVLPQMASAAANTGINTGMSDETRTTDLSVLLDRLKDLRSQI